MYVNIVIKYLNSEIFLNIQYYYLKILKTVIFIHTK